jgi:tetratricopeptide (TPR) repeat protein
VAANDAAGAGHGIPAVNEERRARAAGLRRRAETHIASAGWLSARELLQDALDIYRQEGDASGESACLRDLGDVAFKLKETAEASAFYEQALAVAEGASDRESRAETTYRLADLARAAGRGSEASALFRSAADMFQELNLRRLQAQCLGMLGEVKRQEGADQEALALYRQAQRLQVDDGDLRGAAVTLTFMANLLKDREPAQAAAAFAQAGQIFEGLGMPHRAEPFLAAARRLDPASAPPAAARPPGPWDQDE